jgi:hypothetical protein
VCLLRVLRMQSVTVTAAEGAGTLTHGMSRSVELAGLHAVAYIQAATGTFVTAATIEFIATRSVPMFLEVLELSNRPHSARSERSSLANVHVVETPFGDDTESKAFDADILPAIVTSGFSASVPRPGTGGGQASRLPGLSASLPPGRAGGDPRQQAWGTPVGSRIESRPSMPDGLESHMTGLREHFELQLRASVTKHADDMAITQRELDLSKQQVAEVSRQLQDAHERLIEMDAKHRSSLAQLSRLESTAKLDLSASDARTLTELLRRCEESLEVEQAARGRLRDLLKSERAAFDSERAEWAERVSKLRAANASGQLVTVLGDEGGSGSTIMSRAIAREAEAGSRLAACRTKCEELEVKLRRQHATEGTIRDELLAEQSRVKRLQAQLEVSNQMIQALRDEMQSSAPKADGIAERAAQSATDSTVRRYQRELALVNEQLKEEVQANSKLQEDIAKLKVELAESSAGVTEAQRGADEQRSAELTSLREELEREMTVAVRLAKEDTGREFAVKLQRAEAALEEARRQLPLQLKTAREESAAVAQTSQARCNEMQKTLEVLTGKLAVDSKEAALAKRVAVLEGLLAERETTLVTALNDRSIAISHGAELAAASASLVDSMREETNKEVARARQSALDQIAQTVSKLEREAADRASAHDRELAELESVRGELREALATISELRRQNDDLTSQLSAQVSKGNADVALERARSEARIAEAVGAKSRELTTKFSKELRSERERMQQESLALAAELSLSEQDAQGLLALARKQANHTLTARVRILETKLEDEHLASLRTIEMKESQIQQLLSDRRSEAVRHQTALTKAVQLARSDEASRERLRHDRVLRSLEASYESKIAGMRRENDQKLVRAVSEALESATAAADERVRLAQQHANESRSLAVEAVEATMHAKLHRQVATVATELLGGRSISEVSSSDPSVPLFAGSALRHDDSSAAQIEALEEQVQTLISKLGAAETALANAHADRQKSERLLFEESAAKQLEVEEGAARRESDLKAEVMQLRSELASAREQFRLDVAKVTEDLRQHAREREEAARMEGDKRLHEALGEQEARLSALHETEMRKVAQSRQEEIEEAIAAAKLEWSENVEDTIAAMSTGDRAASELIRANERRFSDQLLSMERQRRESERDLQEQVREQQRIVSRLKREHEAALDRARKERDRSISEALREAGVKHREELSSQEARMRSQARDAVEQVLKDAEAAYERRKRELVSVHREASDKMAREVGEVTEVSRKEAEADFGTRLEQMRSDFRRENDQVKLQGRRDLDDMERFYRGEISKVRDDHAAEVSSLKEQLVRLKESEAQTAQRLWQEQEASKTKLQHVKEEYEVSKAAEVASVEAELRAKIDSAQHEVSQGADIIQGLMREAETLTAKVEELQQTVRTLEQEGARQAERGRVTVEEAVAKAVSECQEAEKQVIRGLEDQLSRLREEHNATIAAHEAALKEREDASQREKALILKSSEEEGRLNALEREELEKRMVDEQKEKITRVRRELENRILSMSKDHEEQLSAAHERFETELAQQKESWQKRLSRETDRAARRARDEADDEHRERLLSLEDEVRREIDRTTKEVRESHDQEVKQLETRHKREVDMLTKEHGEAVDALRKDAADQLEAEKDHWRRVMEEDRALHASTLAALEQRLRDSIEDTRRKAASEKADAVRDAVQSALAEAEAQRGEGADELEKQRDTFKAEVSGLRVTVARLEAEGELSRRSAESERRKMMLEAERATMRAEDSLAAAMRYGPQVVKEQVRRAISEAEKALEEGLESAHRDMQAELHRKTAELNDRAAKQAELLANMRQEWMGEKRRLEAALDDARGRSRALEESHSKDDRIVQDKLDRVRKEVEEAGMAKLKTMQHEHEQFVSRLKASVAQEAEEALNDALDKQKGVLTKQHEMELSELKGRFREQMSEFERSTEGMWRERFEALEKKHEVQLNAAFDRALKDREKSVRDQALEHKQELETQSARFDTRMQLQKDEHHAEMLKLQEEQRKAMRDLQEQTASQVAAEVTKAKNAAMLDAQEMLVKARQEWQRETNAKLKDKDQELLATVTTIQDEAAKLSEVHNQAIETMMMREEDVRAGLLRGHDNALQDTIAKVMAEADDEKAAAIGAFNVEWQTKYDEEVDRLQVLHERTLEELRAQVADETTKLLEQSERERQQALEAFMDEAQAEREQLLLDKEHSVAESIQVTKDEAALALEAAMAQAKADQERAVQAALSMAAKEKTAAIQEVRRQAAREQENAMEELREESEKLLASIESAMRKMRDERDLTEADLTDARAQIRKMEAEVEEEKRVNGRLRNAGRSMQLTMAYLIARFVRAQNALVLQNRATLKEAEKRVGKMWQERITKLELLLQDKQDAVEKLLDMKQALYETLTTHKREMLMEHKMRSTVLQKELADANEEKEKLTKQHGQLRQIMGEVEGSVKAVEKELGELSRQGVVQDGRVNVSLARKKKRMDRDLDALLLKLNDQKVALNDVEKHLSSVEDKRIEKEEELKYVEAQLVTTLIQQQRQLMSVIQSVQLDIRALRPESAAREQAEPLRFDELLTDAPEAPPRREAVVPKRPASRAKSAGSAALVDEGKSGSEDEMLLARFAGAHVHSLHSLPDGDDDDSDDGILADTSLASGTDRRSGMFWGSASEDV